MNVHCFYYDIVGGPPLAQAPSDAAARDSHRELLPALPPPLAGFSFAYCCCTSMFLTLTEDRLCLR